MTDDLSTVIDYFCRVQVRQDSVADVDVSSCGSVQPSKDIEQCGLSATTWTYDRDHTPRFDLKIDPAQSLHLYPAELVGFDERIHYNRDGAHANLTVLLIFERSFRAAVIAGRKTPRNNSPIIAKMFSEAHSGKTTLRGARRLA